MKVAPIKVEYVDKMGSDLSIVNAARVSFDKISESLSDGDRRLINYLARHNHWSPFAHTSLQLRIKAPIFVARQLVKHQVGLVWNEVSRRYVDSEPEFYIPEDFRARAENAKQGSSDVVVADNDAVWYDVSDATARALRTYNSLLADNVCPEQARMILPLNTMTEWIWTGNVMSFARVCNLRLDPHAQKECRDVAEQIAVIATEHFPESFSALIE